ncbi:uncharacterized protein LOC123525781 [Mercenaria mercenaria]|uniref:uncharacterized protein LOC123525781 n=1 Tax=Mercenaria mercenaria TaxID=6596 RepID=UPI00234F5F5E|nr:uncharacterized protein LOC123525781 [Mercenaria mercenaria]
MPQVQRSHNVIVIFILPGGVLSGLLQLAGNVTPGWTRWTRTQNRMWSHEIGIWYTLKCGKHTCNIEGLDAAGPIHVQMAIALVACFFVAIYLMFIKTRGSGIQVKHLAISAYFSLMSGILSVMPVVYHVYYVMPADGSFAYSSLLVGMGGVLALMVSGTSLWQVCSNLTTREQRLELTPVHSQRDGNTLL